MQTSRMVITASGAPVNQTNSTKLVKLSNLLGPNLGTGPELSCHAMSAHVKAELGNAKEYRSHRMITPHLVYVLHVT